MLEEEARGGGIKEVDMMVWIKSSCKMKEGVDSVLDGEHAYPALF